MREGRNAEAAAPTLSSALRTFSVRLSTNICLCASFFFNAKAFFASERETREGGKGGESLWWRLTSLSLWLFLPPIMQRSHVLCMKNPPLVQYIVKLLRAIIKGPRTL